MLRILASLDVAFLKREAVDIGHFVDALKKSKTHMKRLETLIARIEHPKHMNMKSELAAAMCVA